MKRLSYIVIFIVGIVGLMEWLSRGYLASWEPRLRTYLETTASRMTHKTVRIDGITITPFRSVQILNFTISDPERPETPLFAANQIDLSLTPWGIPQAFLKREPLRAIGSIRVKEPRIKISKADLTLPPQSNKSLSIITWFSLSWEGATFQFEDPRAPHGQWTLYQGAGSYKIRGPQTRFELRGSLPEARFVHLEWSQLGKRWSARFNAEGGQSQSVIHLIELFTKRPVLPAQTRLEGSYELDARASGRHFPRHGDDWLEFLDQSELILTPDATPVISTATAALSLNGLFTYKNRTITSPQATLQTPWVNAQGKMSLSLEKKQGLFRVGISAEVASGKIGWQPFQDGRLQMAYHRGQWEVADVTAKLLNGQASVKGTLSPTATDLAMTAENIAVAELMPVWLRPHVKGLLNASCSLRGSFQNLQLTGAWWLNDAQWGPVVLGNARGDLSINPQQFQAEGRSDQTRFRLSLAGIRSKHEIDWDHIEVYLPGGATVSAGGKYHRLRRKYQFTANAAQVGIPTDLPFLRLGRTPLQGRVMAQAQLTGTSENPVLKITARSSDLVFQGQPLGESSALLLFQNQTFDIPTFQLSPGIQGKYVNRMGSVKIQDATVGKWFFSQGTLQFKTAPQLFEITQLSIESRKAALTGRAKAFWGSSPGQPTPEIRLSGAGQLQNRPQTKAWKIPFEFSGKMISSDTAHAGDFDIQARVLDGVLKGRYKFSGTPEEPEYIFTGHLANAKWEAYPLSTDIEGHWSRNGLSPLRLKGRFATGGDFEFTGELGPDAQARGSLKLNAFNLEPLSTSLQFPKPLQGLVQATLTLNGPLDQLQWSGRLTGGPLVYAPKSERPYRVENIDLNLTLAKPPTGSATHRLTITEGHIKTAEELVRFHAKSFMDFSGKNPAKLSMGADLRNVHLGLFTLFGGVHLDGQWQIKPEGFAIEARTQSRSLFINDYELEEGAVLADYYNGVLKFSPVPNSPALITGTINFQQAPQLQLTNLYITGKFGQGLRLSGELGPRRWNYEMEGEGLDLSTLAELAGFPYSLSGVANVHIVGRGDSAHPHIEGKVELSRGAALGLAYRSGQATFLWQDDKITFSKLYLTDPGRYGIEGSGVFPLRPKSAASNEELSSLPVDFSLQLKDANLGLLQSFSSEVKSAKGPVEGLLQIKGTLRDPTLHGSLRVINAEINGAHYFRTLRAANLHLEFDTDTILVKEVRGKSGDGEFRGTGKIKLAGFIPQSYDLQLGVVSKRGLDVEVPELAIPDSPLAKQFKFLTTASKVQLQGQVALRGPAEAPTFSGEVQISNGHFTFPPSRKQPSSRATLNWFRRIYWDVNLRFMEGAWFENELVQAKVLGNLALKGPSDQLVVDGGLDIPEGRVSYLGLQFEIQQARYDIRSEKSGDKVVNRPYVRGVAESRAQAVDTVSGVAGGSRLSTNDTITLNIDYAPIDQIKPRLTSANDPTMTQDKLLARVTQTDLENLTPQERTYLYQKQLVSLIDSSLTTPLAQNVLKKVGIADRFRVQHLFDPNAVSSDLNATSPQQNSSVNLIANTKYTVEKDLSNRISLGYGVRFLPSATTDPALQERKLDLVSDVQLSYRWFSNVFLRGSFDLPNANPSLLPDRRVTIEPRWRFGWWGNTNKKKPD